MTFTLHPLVSSDLNHDPHSCTILIDQTKVMDGNFVNIMGWYDNEWGFSNRMADVTAVLAKTLWTISSTPIERRASALRFHSAAAPSSKCHRDSHGCCSAVPVSSHWSIRD